MEALKRLVISFVCVFLFFAVGSGVGCGVKKPPLPPLVEKKGAIEQKSKDEVRKKDGESPREVRENERNRK